VPIQKIVRAGQIAYKVQIRRKGFPSTFQTFARFSDARSFEKRTLREQAAMCAYGCNVHLTVEEAIAAARRATTSRSFGPTASRTSPTGNGVWGTAISRP
jgi:hypothetical protein